MTFNLFNSAVAAVAMVLAAAAILFGVSPVVAQTTPCEAVFEPTLTGGIAQADAYLRRQWAMIGSNWVAAYRLEGEKSSPFDPDRLRQQLPQRPAEGTAGKPAAPGPRKAAPLPPITGFATARDVRCNATAASARPDVLLIYTAAGVRFQEGKGPWSEVIPDAVVAAIHLRGAGNGWTIVDRTAERGAMPPDANRTPPPDTLARSLATEPWLPTKRRRKPRRD